MARKLSTVQAKSRLADCLRAAESGEAVIITRHGRPVAALVAVDRVALPGRRGAREGGGLADLAGGWKGSGDLVKALTKVRRTPARRLVRLDD
ncbi:MAG: type II toxin-antitoxin system prevent-host-death family antitoxin [Candidatus Rokubacteria bacterium]|nr:type II toxin-antitoxin system prevent-host-death family antitoxin [Candidatus Rokubacteria bacterium]